MTVQQILFLLLVLSFNEPASSTDLTTTPFCVGSQYEYSYSTEITLNELDKFHFTANVYLSPYAMHQCEEKEGVLMRQDLFGDLKCTAVQLLLTDIQFLSIKAREHGHDVFEHNLNFSQWFSFYQRQDGLISNVRYPEDEDKKVLQVKKAVTSSFSLRFHNYVKKKGTNGKHGGWVYRLPDLDHSGTHSARYSVEENSKKIVYKKVHTNYENDHTHNKETHIIKETGHIHSIKVMDRVDASQSTYSSEGIPPIKANGLAHVNLVTKSEVDAETIIEPSGLILDSIIAQEVLKDPILYRKANPQILSNISAVEYCYPNPRDITCVHKIRDIVNIIENLEDKDIDRVATNFLSCPFRNRHKHVLIMIDVLGMCNRASCQIAVVKHLNSSCVEKETAMNILSHIATVKLPSLFTIDIMDQLAFHPSNFPAQLHNETLINMAILALGSMSAALRKTDPQLSDKVVAKLHRMTLPHDHERYRRDSVQEPLDKLTSQSEALMRQSSLIDSLGNAASEGSFTFFKAYIESEHAPSLLRRSAIHSMRQYESDEAADVILSSALIDRDELVRYEATLQYSKHPKADEMSDILSDFNNYTNAQQSPVGASKKRIRRFNIFDALSFRLQAPGFNWRKVLGSTDFGVSMGLIVRNIMELNIKPLSGKFEIDVHDEGYFVGHLEYVGFRLDIFRARVCFKGRIAYNLNILQELGINSFSDLADIYDRTIGAVVTNIKEAIENFRQVLGVDIDVSYLFQLLVDAVAELPFIIEEFVVGPTLRRILEQLKQLPFIQKGLMLVDEITTLYENVRSDVLMFYQEISDCVTVTLPWVGETIKASIITIGKSIVNFFRNPLVSLRDVIGAVFQLRTAFEAVIDCKDTLVSAAKFQGAHIRGWMDLVNRLRGIYDTTIETKDLIIEQAKSFSEIRDVSSFEKSTGLDLTVLRMKVYEDLKMEFQRLIEPLAPLLTLIEPFINAFTSVIKVIKSAINAYEVLRDTYAKVRDLIERIFGPKFHRKFPRQIRGDDGCEQTSCECGFYPTTSGNTKVYRSGLQVEATVGNNLVAPTDGMYLRLPNNQVLIYPTGSFRKYVIMIYNVNLIKSITYSGINVQSGDVIGTVSRSTCDPNFVHLTVLTKSGKSTKDPSPFLQPRLLEVPKWIQDCNEYKLVVLGQVIRQGEIIGRPDMKTKKTRGTCKGGSHCSSANIPAGNPPATMSSAYKPKYKDSISSNTNARKGLLPDASSNGPRAPSNRQMGANLDKFLTADQTEEFSKDEGGFTLTVGEGGEEFDFSVNSIKVGAVLDILKNLGSSELNQIITTVENTIDYLREVLDCNNEELVDPSLLDLTSLKNAIKIRGFSTEGDKQTLLDRLLELPPDLCSNIQKSIPSGRWCSISDDCLVLKCASALQMDFISYSVTFSVIIDPCKPSIIIQFQESEEEIDLSNTFGGSRDFMSVSSEFMGLVTINLAVTYILQDSDVSIDFKAYLCMPGESSDDYSHCISEIELLTGAVFTIPSSFDCTTNMRKRNIRQASESSDVTSCGIQIPDFREMTLSEFVTYIKDLGSKTSDSTNNINQIMQDLRNVFLTELLNAIISGESPITSEETDFPTTFDVCVMGSFEIERVKNFFTLDKRVIIVFVPFRFIVKLDGFYGAELTLRLCFLSMVASAKATPFMGLILTASAALSLFVIDVGIKIVGRILDTSLPIQPSIGFKEFPLALRLRVDLQIIPLSISISFFLSLEINLLFFTISKVLIDKEVFSWTAPAILINLLDVSNVDEDSSPPLFSPVEEPDGARRRRAAGAPCAVSQVIGRDYTDPAFLLQIFVSDDRSQVELSYSVGTYSGGDDVVKDDRMSGNSVLIARQLPHSIPLYWTARASNSQGVSAASQCSLETYDTTLPIGRVDFSEFIYSSHPSVLIGEATILDDTKLINQLQAVGYGLGPFGDQTISFTSFNFDASPTSITHRGVEDFILIRNKRLGVIPFKVNSGVELDDCVADCINFPTKCFSINYAIVPRICELLNYIAGDSSLEFEFDAQYSYYEKRGVGEHATFVYENLPLVHNTLYFLNIYLVNELLYEKYLYSPGMLLDFTPPQPGFIMNATINETRHDGCTAAFNQRCEPPEYVTPLEYHYFLQDGPGSECVFNGPIVGTDLRFTRLNTFLSIVFQGYHDLESGIYAYAWFMDFEVCEDGVISPRDPHEHSTSPPADINQGRILQHFDDGSYFITVQALNQVIFGGSGVVTVCHSTPYTIDTSPPIIDSVILISYNSNTNFSVFFYQARDDDSGLMRVELGAGLTTSDISVLAWVPIINNYTATVTYKIDVADGQRAFIRIRATNNVDLMAASFAAEPIIVDRSPPIPGVVLDGEGIGLSDWRYQPSSSRICAKWNNFFDPESGISAYRWGVGTAPGLSDIVSFTDDLPSDQTDICRDGVTLLHNTTYYSTIIAFNADTFMPKNSSSSSNGVLVDLTDPIGGYVIDGLEINEVIYYTSNPTMVQAVWGNFSDPESGISEYNVTIYVAGVLNILPDMNPSPNQQCPNQSNSTTIPIKPPFIPPNDVEFRVAQDTVSVGLDEEIHYKHFYFSHGDYIRTGVTGQDGATRTTEVMSQGVLVDLTPPKIIQLYDGPNSGIDESYQTSITSLSVSWMMVDKESGISEYQLSVYARVQGSTSKFFPTNAPFITLQPQEVGESGILNCWTGDIQLSVGTLYTVRVVPINRAKLSTIYTSSGIIPDNTPPIIDFIRIGTYGDESEELTQENAVEIGNSGRIPVQWAANDPESGVVSFVAAVGTTAGGTDVSDFIDYSSDGNVGIPVQLQLFEDIGKYYYVTAQAKNGAGLLSEPLISSKIKVLRANVAGIVTVGHSGVGIDGKYQAESDTVTLMFEGFSSELCGLLYYEWAVGTSFAGDQIQEFTTAGVVMGEEGAGVSQALVPLDLGVKVYTQVRAITACSSGIGQSTIDSFGDAILVDWTNPNLVLTDLGQQTNGETYKYPQTGDKIYQYDPSTLVARWEATDPQSGIHNVRYYVGTHPYTADVQQAKLTSRTSIASNDVLPEATGSPNILHLSVFNRAGVETFQISPGITIDTLLPNTDRLKFTCTKYVVTSIDSLVCSWFGAYDRFSEVNSYEILLGNEEIDATYYYESLSSNTLTVTIRNFTNPLVVGNLVYTLKVINSVGLSNQVFAPLTVDDTPPIPQSVFVLTDQTYTVFLPAGDANSTFTYENETSTGVTCKTIVSDIRIRWEDFTDIETPMDYYEIGMGEKRGQMNIINFFYVGLVNEYFIEGIDLTRYKVVFVIIRGFNKAGLIQAANSNPIYLSLRYPDPGYVNDGSLSQDLDAQSGTTFLEGFWNFNDPCVTAQFDWGISYMNETTIQDFTRVGTTDSSNDNLAMQQDSKVYISVTMFSSIGYVRSMRSDGVVVQVDPLIPGLVYDGPIPGYDFDSQASLTSIMANWNSFGGADPERLSEMVIKYEIGIGTGPRGEERFDIVQYQDVYLNTSTTVRLLELERNITYYVTIRATSGTFQQAEATSNGIQPIEFDNIAEPGSVEIPPYQSATTVLDITWKNFTSLLPIAFYEYAISTNGDLAEFSCETVDNAADPLPEYFTIRKYTRTVLDASVVASDLELMGGIQYYAYIRAVDNSFQCTAAVSHPIIIDTTPPLLGTFNIGFNLSSVRPELIQPQIYYITSNDTLSVHWDGFYDPESSIANFQIALFDQDECNLLECNQLSNSTNFTTINNVDNYTFFVLELVMDKFYYVALRGVNQAALTSCRVSQPIKLVASSLSPAIVKYGFNWQMSPPYQGSTSSVNGILALVRNEHDALCMDRMYNKSAPTEDWDSLVQTVTPTIPVGPNNPTGRTVKYHPQQVQFNTNNAYLKISMTRDIQTEIMLSGAAVTPMSVVDTNEVRVRIKAAGEYRAVTSVIFWEGSGSVIQEYEMLYESDNDTQSISSGNLPTQSPSTCQYMPPPNPNPSPSKAFGLQLHPAYTNNSARALLWYRSDIPGETGETWIDLNHDPTTAFHTYDFKLDRTASTTPSTDVQGTWSFSLTVDGQYIGNLVDLPQIGANINFGLHVRNFNGRVEPFSDPFLPPTTTALFTDINLPADSSRVCTYGTPFFSKSAPFIQFEVGVGREFGSTEVTLAAGAEYQSITPPCIPCVEECLNMSDINRCNSSCDSDVFFIEFVASELTLSSGCTMPYNVTNATCTLYNVTETGIPENKLFQYNLTFVPYVYYMTVRGYTATGDVVYGYSQGIQLDTTPPNCTLPQHIEKDLRSDQLLNTSIQESDTSLAVEYQCEDTRSDIYDYQIAYTDRLDYDDSLEFTSVGTITRVNITDIKLIPQITYYVVVRAINGAGLSTTIVSDGVLIITKDPDLSETVIRPLSSILVDTLVPNSYLSTTLASIGLNWTGISAVRDGELPNIFWRVGTEPIEDDIMPIFEITYMGNAIRFQGTEVIGNDSIVVSGTSGVAMLANRTEGSYTGNEDIMLVEPGRILYETLVVCAIQPNCKDAEIQSVTYYRDTLDTYSVYDITTQYSLSVDDGFVEYSSGVTAQFIPPQLYPTNCRVYFSDDLKDKSGFLIGPLSLRAMMADYEIFSAPSYVPYIADPTITLTQVDRFLFSRVQEFHGPAFYVSPIGGVSFPSLLKIEVKFNALQFNGTEEPILIVWNPEQELWISSQSSCNFAKENTITGNTLTTYFCPCLVSSKRCNKPWQFILVVGTITFDDTPPKPDSVPCISIGEGSGTIQHMITFTDLEFDTVDVNLVSVTFTQSSSEYATGEDATSLLNAGINGSLFYFTPCKGCYGNLTVQYSLTETGTPMLLGTPLSADNEFIIEILAVNANPELYLNLSDTSSVITLYREQNTSVATFQLTGYTYDVDGGDSVLLAYKNCTHCKLVISEMAPSPVSVIPTQYRTSSRSFVLHYTADAAYYGSDQIGIIALDRYGAFSLAYILSISIEFKHCLNNASCKGPVNDPDCNEISESVDFSSEYSCECTEEWVLRRCDKPNLCLSQPCHPNATCQIRENGAYECLCQPGWPCAQTLTAGEISATVLSIAIIVLTIVFVVLVLLIYLKRRRRGGYDVKKEIDVDVIFSNPGNVTNLGKDNTDEAVECAEVLDSVVIENPMFRKSTESVYSDKT